MSASTHSATELAQARYCLAHADWAAVISQTQNLLIIQDLDGVCMQLVKDPLDRVLDPGYVQATQRLDGHFFVLTNGEHVGARGVNTIVQKAFPGQDLTAQSLHLPGLAAGGVQWQDRQGNVSHPGVSEAELAFLQQVGQQMQAQLQAFLSTKNIPQEQCEMLLAASILADNVASPTANLNTAFAVLPEHYAELQALFYQLTLDLLAQAQKQGLGDSFFVHYAPNLGRDTQGLEILRPATATDSGTSDFQFMLRGGIKEAGVLGILNRYYGQQFGAYPLGKDFNVRQAPQDMDALLALIINNFDLEKLPLIIGVGDTVNSQVTPEGVKRGGSDRNFLQLIHTLKQTTGQPHLTVYVDSSRGEVKNRRSLQLETRNGVEAVVAGPGDPADTQEPLTLNVAFPGGYGQYVQWFKTAATARDI
ncbi:MAG: glucosylglycerol 3-phosphatase [Cyanobacteria bacterium P01_G01_bin.54]